MALVLSGYLCCSSPLQCLCHDISKAVAVHLSVCEPIRTLNAAHPSARVTFFSRSCYEVVLFPTQASATFPEAETGGVGSPTGQTGP